MINLPPNIQVLNPFTVPLQGVSLIEASAGTGKTYTVTLLFIRLILEKNLTVDKILVVTFTEAATEELRDRIRRRLHEALLAFENHYSDDDVLSQLIQQHENHEEAIFRLKNALRGFDEAAIFTIHSFCRQMLSNNAFESGLLFDTELISDPSPLLKEIVEDFWRQMFYHASSLFITYALENGYKKPASLLDTLKQGQYVGQPFLKIIPQLSPPVTEAQELAFQELFREAQQIWKKCAEEIKILLCAACAVDASLNRKKYPEKSIPQWCTQLDNFFGAPMQSVKLPERFEKFTRRELATSVNKGKRPPHHDFFDLGDQLFDHAQQLSDSFKRHLLSLKVKLFKEAEQKLAWKKLQHRIQSFDDLLINLYHALQGSSGVRLTYLIRKKYHAALIDEFQDTDPVQYEIFHRLYGTGEHTLFLIGDPKQAIYSFRGADIFTYLVASHNATHHHTLTINWRSEPYLIASVNQLFQQSTRPFLFEDIVFHSAQTPVSRPQEPPRLQIEGQSLPPLQIWFISKQQAETPAEKQITKEWANKHIPLAVGYEIARLVKLAQLGEATLGGQPLIAGDIAILVRTNIQARLMQKTLTRLQIPSVLYSRESLFASHEVMEIERVLLAIAEASREPLLKAALTTDMWGFKGDELYELMTQEETWQTYLHRFQKYYSLWQHVGFIQMFRTLLLEEHMQERLLRYPNGERRLTNVLHAAEVLQQASVSQKLGIRGLCQWLSQQRQLESEVTEEQQLRLESDEKRVKIVTIHKSKGLEYPIVFCPFVWDGYLHTSGKKQKQFTFHNEQGKLTLDLGSDDQEKHRERAKEEEKAENLRLFYVAVTRAKHRCYLVWGALRDADTSALAHLLHPNLASVEKADDDTLWTQLKQLESDANNTNNTLQVSPLPLDNPYYQRPATPSDILQARPFLGNLAKDWKVSSFSSLTVTTPDREDTLADHPDYDEITSYETLLEDDWSPDKQNIFSFPRGARAGNFIHALFENLDFTKPDKEVIKTQLQAFGYDVKRWQTVIATWIDDVLHTPLEPQRRNFTLSRIGNEMRLNELEFYYPLATTVTQEGLHTLFGDSHLQPDDDLRVAWQEQIGRLSFSPVRGFMKGFIDLIFQFEGRYYLVDYKSNFLGSRPNNYHHSQLEEIMTRKAYFLQYHVYTIALHRYLSVRIPNYCYEQHFGGVYYLFVRGMQPHQGANYGIYRDLPKGELVDKLSTYLYNG